MQFSEATKDSNDSARNEPRSGAPSECRKPPGLRLPGMKVLPPPVRKRLRQSVIDVLRRDAPAPDYDHPVGDPGLFGPDTITWKIHADFPSMMAGGLGALMLQSLHPLALAGVWDHSDFRTDTLARLRSTIAFVARTSYAPREAAERAIERVRSVHRHVHGVAPDGRPYSAEDPHLLTWVHCAEAWSFLRGYQTYCYGRIPRSAQDRYLHETARVAEALGARDVPKSLAELKAYFDSMRPELICDARTREVLAVLNAIRLPIPLPGFARNLFMGAGAALLPDWALDLMGRSRLDRLRDEAAARFLKLMAPSIREAMSEGGLTWRACLRTGADYASLFCWTDSET
ncbi:MAG TPA: oxygenase MpaB family protein [Gammaproteobacteria bacterium]|nr:oxygenase MpaB family protein [Gammaproteobacteria bacterium]